MGWISGVKKRWHNDVKKKAPKPTDRRREKKEKHKTGEKEEDTLHRTTVKHLKTKTLFREGGKKRQKGGTEKDSPQKPAEKHHVGGGSSKIGL